MLVPGGRVTLAAEPRRARHGWTPSHRRAVAPGPHPHYTASKLIISIQVYKPTLREQLHADVSADDVEAQFRAAVAEMGSFDAAVAEMGSFDAALAEFDF